MLTDQLSGRWLPRDVFFMQPQGAVAPFRHRFGQFVGWFQGGGDFFDAFTEQW